MLSRVALETQTCGPVVQFTLLTDMRVLDNTPDAAQIFWLDRDTTASRAPRTLVHRKHLLLGFWPRNALYIQCTHNTLWKFQGIFVGPPLPLFLTLSGCT